MSSFRLKLIVIMVIAVGIAVISLVSFSEIMLEGFCAKKRWIPSDTASMPYCGR